MFASSHGLETAYESVLTLAVSTLGADAETLPPQLPNSALPPPSPAGHELRRPTQGTQLVLADVDAGAFPHFLAVRLLDFLGAATT